VTAGTLTSALWLGWQQKEKVRLKKGRYYAITKADKKEEEMNTVTLFGRLTKNPEITKTDEGLPICHFTLAVDDVFSKNGHTDFIRITVFGKRAETCGKYLFKGKRALVSGRLYADRYEDKEGITRYPVSVIADNVQFIDYVKPAGDIDEQEPDGEENIAEPKSD
jgi:single-strand DNA-binding protein